jgi:predicted GNAT family acetyltransferase
MNVKNNTDKSRFELNVMNKICYLEYSIKLKHIILAHTEVPVELVGQGFAKELLFNAIDFAKSKNFKIIPVCKFSESYLNKHKEYNDIRGDL